MRIDILRGQLIKMQIRLEYDVKFLQRAMVFTQDILELKKSLELSAKRIDKLLNLPDEKLRYLVRLPERKKPGQG